MSWRTYSFRLIGQSPLLMHADRIESTDELKEFRSRPGKKTDPKGDDRCPAWTWHGYCWDDGEYIAMASSCVMAALRAAAQQIPLGKSNYKKLSQSAILPLTEYCEFTSGEKKKKIPVSFLQSIKDKPYDEQCKAVKAYDFILWAKRAAIGMNGKHVRVRPRFKIWEITGELNVLDDIPDNIFRMMFDIAGRGGIGDWRPACRTPGPFGIFKAIVE